MTTETGSEINPPPLPVLPGPQATADYHRRNYALRELLDEPCTFAAYTVAMHDLAQINRLTRAQKPVLNFLERTVARTGVGPAPLEILDIGCAQGDLLRRVHRWAKRRSLPVRLTGLDLNSYASRLARILDRRERLATGTIRWITGDMFVLLKEGASEPKDVILCNLTAHHLSDDQVVELLKLCSTARLGFLLTDLRRSERAASFFKLLARIFRWHPMVTHDGVISFQRAFSLDEWQRLVQQADVKAQVIDLGMGRVAISAETYTASRPAPHAARPV